MEPFFEREGIRAVSVGPVVVVHYGGVIGPGAVKAFVEERRVHAPMSQATLSYVSGAVPLPSADVVAEIFDVARSSDRAILCEAAVIHGGGPIAVGGRAIVNTLFSRVRPTPSRLFSDVPSAARFVAGTVGHPGLEPRLELAVAWLDGIDSASPKSRGKSEPPRESGVRFLDPVGRDRESRPPWHDSSRDVSVRRAR